MAKNLIALKHSSKVKQKIKNFKYLKTHFLHLSNITFFSLMAKWRLWLKLGVCKKPKQHREADK